MIRMDRTATVHTLEEWNAIIEHEVRSFAKTLQAVKKQLQLFIAEDPDANVDALQSSFNRVEKQIHSIVTILEDPDPVFESFNDFESSFMHSVQLIRDQSENPSDLAQDISQDMILLATTVKNAEFLMFRGEDDGEGDDDDEEVHRKVTEEYKKGSFIFGRDEYSLQLQNKGLNHVDKDGHSKALLNEHLPPVLDLQETIWKMEQEEELEQEDFGEDKQNSSTHEHVLDDLVEENEGEEQEEEEEEEIEPLKSPETMELSEKKKKRQTTYSTLQMSTFERGFGEYLAHFTSESSRFWKWLSLDPSERSAEKGRGHFHTMIKHVNHICAISSTPTLGIEKQVQKFTATFQQIDAKSNEPIPRFLLLQVTETLISLAGIIKGTIALNVLNKRKSIFLGGEGKARPKIHTLLGNGNEAIKVFRIMVVGHDAVGKSTLIRKFCKKDTENVTPTQGIELKVYKFKMDDEYVELQILDAAGKRLFREILDEFYQVVEGIVVVYDMTSADSFGDIHLWMRGLEKFTFLQKIIVGNKCDLENLREVPHWRAQNLAEEYNVQYMESSCESGYNIEEVFLTVIRNIQASLEAGNHSDDEHDDFVEVVVGQKSKTPMSKSSRKVLHSCIKVNKYQFLTTC